jgi:drug/metabolite transporter (DMT)-like permease
MCLISGVPFLLIKIAVRQLSPASVVLARCAIAAVILLPIAAARGHLGVVLPRWRSLAAFATLGMTVPWLLLAEAQKSLSISLTGLLVATIPIVGAALARISGHERIEGRRLTGLAVGIAGVVTIVGLDIGSVDLAAVAALTGAVVAGAWAPFILARNFADVPALGVISTSLALSALLAAPVGITQWPNTPSLETWLAVLALGAISTALSFLVLFVLVAEVGPSRSMVFGYVTPAVTTTLGVVVLNEKVTPVMGTGFALILAGCLLANRGPRPRVAATL